VKRVRYDGRGRLRVFGHELAHNQVAEMSDEEAAKLAAHPHLRVTVLGVTVHRSGGGDEQTHEEEDTDARPA
jgi:hypothetical protein